MLVQPELALDAYLEALLATVPEADVELDVDVPVLEVETLTAVTEPVTEAVAQIAPIESVESEALAQPDAEGEFHALFFRIGGLTLATPVLGLKRIVDFDFTAMSVTALPNQPSWLLGLVENQGETLGVMHTAELLLGQEKSMRRDFMAEPYRKIIISRQGRYGFACDEVLEMVKLRPEDVRWRANRHGDHRAWLMGTVSERLSVLVDLAELTPIRR
ncbi:chemotaxis protein CheW [Methylogaea oryzae]|uniref:CheW-like domain-containing protein n=1 Tax=Methylogaea oryzae TaxID=1295382 RepID=A0A8D5AK67_9GAMM|nr:chemotaxis protein CheW [Methylogaea oryzae]BBL71489.1 hypothetical protein MoryE10_20950 [Methylogaea oryzae]